MKRLVSRMTAVGLVVMFVVASIGLSAQAAEKKKISGTNKRERIVSQTTVNPGDVPNHELVQGVRINSNTSSNADFNGEAMAYYQDDHVAGSGSHRVYWTLTNKNGDRATLFSEGTHKTTTKEGGARETTWEGKCQWMGGTGKFKNIKGPCTYTGKANSEGVWINNWEGEVEY